MKNQSLAWRAFMAVLLTIGFYALAIGIAAALLIGVYLEVVYSSHILIKPTIFAVVAACVILWSILPRIDRFVAPGPRLQPSAQPELFKVIRDVAKATEQEMPREVFLVGDVNAWVTQRGGMMGIGSRRVMGIGLPLLQTLTIPQFRAVIAHEFGHYHGGDTKLGPWIYKTRQAITRTIINLARSGSSMHKPFIWYGGFFMRVTQSISRAQESAADVLSAKVAGARNAIDALMAVHRAATVYQAYWESEVVPVLSHGFRPPIAAGLAHFMGQEHIAKSLHDLVQQELKEGQADPYDSHPPLRERVAALEPLAKNQRSDEAPLAATLLRSIDVVELELLRTLATDPSAVAALAKVEWNETATRVFLPEWQANVSRNAEALREVGPLMLPALATTLPKFCKRLNLQGVPMDERNAAAQAILGSALAVRLHGDGWVCDATPGRQITLSKGSDSIAPFTVMPRLMKGELTAESWTAECARLGISERPLAE